jgi:hypothetical protein
MYTKKNVAILAPNLLLNVELTIVRNFENFSKFIVTRILPKKDIVLTDVNFTYDKCGKFHLITNRTSRNTSLFDFVTLTHSNCNNLFEVFNHWCFQ